MDQIINFMQISERIASSGQPEDSQFRAIRDAGYEVVINLAMPNSEDAIPEEGNLVTAYGMNYVNIPVPWEAPTRQQLRQFIGVMQAFETNKIWVHCVKNYRVSAFLYQYYRSLGYSTADAKAVILPQWEPIPVWQNFMEISLAG